MSNYVFFADYFIKDGFLQGYISNINNNAILNGVQNELGQQGNDIANLTSYVIQQSQQATQQGGSGGGESSTSAGISAFNGDQNFQNRLNYFKQALAEQSKTNLEGFLGYCDTSPIMQSILTDGKDSPYLAEVSSEQAQEISDALKSLYEKAVNLQRLKEQQVSDEIYKAYLDESSKTLDELGDRLGMLDFVLAYADVDLAKINPALAKIAPWLGPIINGFSIGVKKEQVNLAKKQLLEKYPDYESHINYYNNYPVEGFVSPYQVSRIREEARIRDRIINSDMYDMVDELGTVDNLF